MPHSITHSPPPRLTRIPRIRFGRAVLTANLCLLLLLWAPTTGTAYTGQVEAAAKAMQEAPSPRETFRTLPSPLPDNETLTYRLKWGFWHVGTATLSIEPARFETAEAKRLTATANSNFLVSLFIKVRDTVSSLVPDDLSRSLQYAKHTREGTYRRDFEVRVDPYRNLAKRQMMGPVAIPAHAQDPLSALYLFRTLSLPGSTILETPATDGRYLDIIRARFIARERITTPMGTFDAVKTMLRVEPLNGVLRTTRDSVILLWVEDGPRRRPLRIVARARVAARKGDLTMELTEDSLAP